MLQGCLQAAKSKHYDQQPAVQCDSGRRVAMTLAKLAIRQKQAQQAQRRYPQLPAGHLDHTVLQAGPGYRLGATEAWPLGPR